MKRQQANGSAGKKGAKVGVDGQVVAGFGELADEGQAIRVKDAGAGGVLLAHDPGRRLGAGSRLEFVQALHIDIEQIIGDIIKCRPS